jgi:2-polyprenyl-3-methyl-5-hydroxy-6-metoxy-1,4-benzoquinol methylase
MHVAELQHQAGKGAGSAVNRDSYNKIAGPWDAARKSFYGRERDYLDAFLNGLAPGSHILDLGCGTGRPMAEYLLGRGYQVTGVDQAAKLLELASARLPQGTWIESRIEDFRSAEPFDGVICWDALFHIERTHHHRLLTRMATMLCPGGRLMLTVGGSAHPAFTDTMFGETFFYDSHPPDTVLSLLRQLGFEPLIAEFLNPPTSGRDKGRYAVVAQLIAPSAPAADE